MMSENLELRFVVANKICKQRDLETKSKERWKRLIEFLLNIDSQASGYDDKLRFFYAQLLQFANYMEPRARQIQTQPSQLIS